MIAACNVSLFMFFLLSFLKPRGSDEWRSKGIVTAFLVAQFEERKTTPEFKDVYREHTLKTPSFIPQLKQWLAFITVQASDSAAK